MLRKQFLKEHRLAKYQYLLLTGKLTEHLNQIDQEKQRTGGNAYGTDGRKTGCN